MKFEETNLNKMKTADLKQMIKQYKNHDKITGLNKKQLVEIAVKLQGSGILKKQKNIKNKNKIGIYKEDPNLKVNIEKSPELLRNSKQELEGEGLLDIFRKPKKEYLNSTKRMIKKYGDYNVISFQIKRAPIMKILNKVLDVVTFGQWNTAKKKYNFDELYHLGVVLKLDLGNNSYKSLIVEKNETITISDKVKIESNAEMFDVPILHPITLNTMLENTRKYTGDDDYYLYDAFKRNCQLFIYNMMIANDLGNQQAYDFVLQDTDQLLKELPGYTSGLMNKVTDLAASTKQTLGMGITEQQKARNAIRSKFRKDLQNDVTGNFMKRNNLAMKRANIDKIEDNKQYRIDRKKKRKEILDTMKQKAALEALQQEKQDKIEDFARSKGWNQQTQHLTDWIAEYQGFKKNSNGVYVRTENSFDAINGALHLDLLLDLATDMGISSLLGPEATALGIDGLISDIRPRFTDLMKADEAPHNFEEELKAKEDEDNYKAFVERYGEPQYDEQGNLILPEGVELEGTGKYKGYGDRALYIARKLKEKEDEAKEKEKLEEDPGELSRRRYAERMEKRKAKGDPKALAYYNRLDEMNKKLDESKAYVELHKSDIKGYGNALNVIESVNYLKKDKEEKILLLEMLLKKFTKDFEKNILILKNEIERLNLNDDDLKYFSKYN
jgi:hypothetical protein